MPDIARSAALKLARARVHLSELDRAVRAYLHDGDAPFEIYEVAEPDCGPQRFRVRVLAAPPDEIGCVLGDVLHNARSALDHAACDLVEAAGGQVGDRTGFPTGPTREVFMQTVKGSMGSASAAVKTAVRGLEVYPGGAGDDLWQLQRLDIRDKHRVLATVAMAHHRVTMTHRIPGLPPLSYDLKGEDAGTLVVDGAVVFEVSEQARFFPDDDGLTPEPSFRFLLSVQEADSAGTSEPVVQLAQRLVARVANVLTELYA